MGFAIRTAIILLSVHHVQSLIVAPKLIEPMRHRHGLTIARQRLCLGVKNDEDHLYYRRDYGNGTSPPPVSLWEHNSKRYRKRPIDDALASPKTTGPRLIQIIAIVLAFVLATWGLEPSDFW
jgi:hypothetical protein